MGQMVDPRADLLGQRAAFQTELPHLAGGGADQTELQLKGKQLLKTTALSTLHRLLGFLHLLIATYLVD
jgi:hypothetical protein